MRLDYNMDHVVASMDTGREKANFGCRGTKAVDAPAAYHFLTLLHVVDKVNFGYRGKKAVDAPAAYHFLLFRNS